MTGENPKGDPDRKSAEQDVTPKRLDHRLLELLVCPVTKSNLDYDADRNELISRKAGLAFPIVDGIPLMTEDAARTLEDKDLK
ncbi:MAG: Trm112 family protein [Hyphomicrobiaceae bacterium]